MDRNEYLAIEIMGWTKSVSFNGRHIWADEVGAGRCFVDKWNPGKSWPQTGMILKQMEKDFYMTVTQYWDYDDTGSEVVFRQ